MVAQEDDEDGRVESFCVHEIRSIILVTEKSNAWISVS
jgi:hypothetical protein